MREAVISKLAVNLVRHDRRVREAREACDELVDLLFRRDAAGRVGGRIEDDEPGPRRHQRQRLFRRKGEAVFLPHGNRNRARAGELDHRAIDGKARIRIDNVDPLFAEHLNRHEHRHLAAGDDHDEIGRHSGAEAAMQILSHRLAQGRNAGCVGIAVLAVAQSLDGGLDDMGRCFEIGLADAEIDDVTPLALQFSRPRQHGEGVFLANALKGGLDGGHCFCVSGGWALLLAKPGPGSKQKRRAAPGGTLKTACFYPSAFSITRLSRAPKAAGSSTLAPSISRASSSTSQAASSISGLSAPSLKRPASARVRGCVGLSSRIGFARSPSRPCAASIFSSWRSGPNSGAIRQATLSVRRSDARTSATSSPSVCLKKANNVATSPDASAGAFAPSARAIDLMSGAPRLTDLTGLPSKPAAVETQKASTGSASNSTSTPRALNPSSW